MKIACNIHSDGTIAVEISNSRSDTDVTRKCAVIVDAMIHMLQDNPEAVGEFLLYNGGEAFQNSVSRIMNGFEDIEPVVRPIKFSLPEKPEICNN